MSVPHLSRIHALALILTTLTLPTAVAQSFDHGSNCNQHGGTSNLDKKTRITTNCDDEGHFSGYSTLMVLWPGDSYNIVRRYAPRIDLDRNGIADGKDNVGYPNLVHRIYLTPQWSSQNGANGFPLNLKRESDFNNFITHLENNGTGRQCIFDTDGCNECIEYEVDEEGNETNICKTWNLVTDPAIPNGEHCPTSFYAGKKCSGKSNPGKKTKDPCTQWKWKTWTPKTNTVCQGKTFQQTKSPVPRSATGKLCNTSQGLPPNRPADQHRTATGTKSDCPPCDPSQAHMCRPECDNDWNPIWNRTALQNVHECDTGDIFRECLADRNTHDTRSGEPGDKPDVWTLISAQAETHLCPRERATYQNTCGESKRVAGTKTNCQIDGKCSSTISGQCDTGTATPLDPATGTWMCQGKHSGRTVTCPAIAENGQCSTTVTGQCSTGTNPLGNGNTAPDGSWTCNGIHGGANVPCPGLPKDGVCGNEKILNDCSVGTSTDENTIAKKWHCNGINGGQKSRQCIFDDPTTRPDSPGTCRIDCPGNNTPPWDHSGNNCNFRYISGWSSSGTCSEDLTKRTCDAQGGDWRSGAAKHGRCCFNSHSNPIFSKYQFSPGNLSCNEPICGQDNNTCDAGTMVNANTHDKSRPYWQCITAGADNNGRSITCNPKANRIACRNYGTGNQRLCMAEYTAPCLGFLCGWTLIGRGGDTCKNKPSNYCFNKYKHMLRE